MALSAAETLEIQHCVGLALVNLMAASTSWFKKFDLESPNLGCPELLLGAYNHA